MPTWTNQATRTTENRRNSSAVRSIVCFEVLDYDSLTHVAVGSEHVNVVALIYKKVTINHNQSREYSLSYSSLVTNAKGIVVPTMIPTYLDPVPVTDNFNYSGSRVIEYRLCLITGTQKQIFELGTLNIENSGFYNLSGTDKELQENSGTLDSSGPNFTVSGNRLYGVNINCGEQAVTYTYDIEELTGNPGNNVLLQTDSPANVEDYNQFWTKTKRVVGAINYLGIRDFKEFNYDGMSGTAIFPDTVLAVCYNKRGG